MQGKEKISPSVNHSRSVMHRLLYAGKNPDMHCRDLVIAGREAAVYYADGFVSADFLQRYVIAPCQQMQPTDEDITLALKENIPGCDIVAAETYDEAVRQVMEGRAVVFVEGMACALGVDVRFFVRRGISPPLTERVVLGPHQGFNESIRDNITLIRRMLPVPGCIGEMRQIGSDIPMSLCVMYLEDAVDPEMLKRLKNRLDKLNVPHVLSLGVLEQLLEDRPRALFPQSLLTERPDRAVSMMLEGQIVLLLDGSPQALVLPVGIFHLLHTPDDTSERFIYGSFLRVIRLFGLLCALLLPGLFAAFTVFHPEALPVTLLTAVLESQAAMPLSIPAETFLMLMMFNLINEAGTRVPGIAGSTLGTVSGLILGQAAVEAKLVHPLLIIVVAVASLGSYAIPDYALRLAVRLAQLLGLAAGCLFGLYGMVLFCVAGLIRLCSLTSLGVPLMAPLSPPRRHHQDVLVRGPAWLQRPGSYLSRRMNFPGRMRGWDRRRHGGN
ncbi:MAG: spore germination protein [Clostridiales bacterium]|nr:spore germination protein [Clostridiales bacterium]